MPRFYWPGYAADVVSYVRNCDHCRHATSGGGFKGPAQPLRIFRPNQRWQIDLKVDVEIVYIKPNGLIGRVSVHLLNCIDCFSKKSWTRALPKRDKETCKRAMIEILAEAGHVPTEMQFDNGGYAVFLIIIVFSFAFNFWLCREWAAILHELLPERNIKYIKIPPRSPWINGIIERLNGVLDLYAKKEPVTSEDPHQLIARALMTRNKIRNRATGCVPDELYASAHDSPLREIAIASLKKQHRYIRTRSVWNVRPNETLVPDILVFFGEEQVPAHGGKFSDYLTFIVSLTYFIIARYKGIGIVQTVSKNGLTATVQLLTSGWLESHQIGSTHKFSIKALKRIFSSSAELTPTLRLGFLTTNALMPDDKNSLMREYLTNFDPASFFDPCYHDDLTMAADGAVIPRGASLDVIDEDADIDDEYSDSDSMDVDLAALSEEQSLAQLSATPVEPLPLASTGIYFSSTYFTLNLFFSSYVYEFVLAEIVPRAVFQQLASLSKPKKATKSSKLSKSASSKSSSKPFTNRVRRARKTARSSTVTVMVESSAASPQSNIADSFNTFLKGYTGGKARWLSNALELATKTVQSDRMVTRRTHSTC